MYGLGLGNCSATRIHPRPFPDVRRAVNQRNIDAACMVMKRATPAVSLLDEDVVDDRLPDEQVDIEATEIWQRIRAVILKKDVLLYRIAEPVFSKQVSPAGFSMVAHPRNGVRGDSWVDLVLTQFDG